jgi:hypothetical protein
MKAEPNGALANDEMEQYNPLQAMSQTRAGIVTPSKEYFFCLLDARVRSRIFLPLLSM